MTNKKELDASLLDPAPMPIGWERRANEPFMSTNTRRLGETDIIDLCCYMNSNIKSNIDEIYCLTFMIDH